MVVNWRKRGTEKHNGQGGESIQQPRRRPSGSRTEISAKFRRGPDIFRKSKLPCAARHGGESCSRWTASGANSGTARGKMHHLGAGTVKSGGGDSFADGDDVVTIFEKISGFFRFFSNSLKNLVKVNHICYTGKQNPLNYYKENID